MYRYVQEFSLESGCQTLSMIKSIFICLTLSSSRLFRSTIELRSKLTRFLHLKKGEFTHQSQDLTETTSQLSSRLYTKETNILIPQPDPAEIRSMSTT